MDQDVLLTFGEVGVALAGFSGIAVTLGKRAEGDWDEADRLRLRDLMVASLGAAMFGFLPAVLAAANMTERQILQYASGVLVLYMLFGAATMLRGAAGRFGPMTWVLIIPSTLIVLMLGLVAADVIYRVAAFAYYLALFWLIILSAANFAKLLIGDR
jgi:hypothetical protein